jgi:alkaline phosphatase D
MPDTRSLRENNRRGEYGAYLGEEQMNWLKKTLKNSEAPFKVISSGTMWSDYITPGKDSWGTWDTKGREELFQFIEDENISGVLLVSGDRHGTRGFTIPRSSGFSFYEFQVASLAGVPGPVAFAEDNSTQLFGYHGTDKIAYGEFTFDTTGNKQSVTFRLIDEYGNVQEEIFLPFQKLTPREE